MDHDYDLDVTPLCVGFDLRLHDITVEINPTMRTAITAVGPIVAETAETLTNALRLAGYDAHLADT